MERKNDIIIDSYYLIELFHKNGKKITQLHVQKLMFIFEAFYMNMAEIDSLYECGYKAWNFGPVAPKLYKRYKNCGKNDIILTEEEIKLGEGITDEKKKALETLFNIFKDFSAMQLVAFTHSANSPWKKVWDSNQYGDISKLDMKEWFKKYIE